MNMSYWNNLTLEQRQKVKSYLYKIEKQKQIIEKAVEYLKEHSSNGQHFMEWFECSDLLNILNGKEGV